MGILVRALLNRYAWLLAKHIRESSQSRTVCQSLGHNASETPVALEGSKEPHSVGTEPACHLQRFEVLL